MVLLERITTDSVDRIVLDGITVDQVTTDGSYGFKRIQFSDKKGNFVSVEPGQYSDSFQVCVKKPPKLVKKYQLKGTFMDLDVEKIFDLSSDAEAEKTSLTQKAEDLRATCELEITEIEVEESK